MVVVFLLASIDYIQDLILVNLSANPLFINAGEWWPLIAVSLSIFFLYVSLDGVFK